MEIVIVPLRAKSLIVNAYESPPLGTISTFGNGPAAKHGAHLLGLNVPVVSHNAKSLAREAHVRCRRRVPESDGAVVVAP